MIERMGGTETMQLCKNFDVLCQQALLLCDEFDVESADLTLLLVFAMDRGLKSSIILAKRISNKIDDYRRLIVYKENRLTDYKKSRESYFMSDDEFKLHQKEIRRQLVSITKIQGHIEQHLAVLKTLNDGLFESHRLDFIHQ